VNLSLYEKSIGTSEKYQNQNLKAIINYANFLGAEITFYDIQRREQITAFLDTKIKSNNIDPDKKWITTWNDYLWRIKYFLR
jgi:integrase/recombinase XerD